MSDQDPLPNGPLSARTAHLCIDMQNLFAERTAWHTPWLKRVLPAVERLARHRPERTVFTRFVPPERAEQMRGRWRAYYERWQEMTLERLDPRLVELVPALAALAPPATVIDKMVYSPFHGTKLVEHLEAQGIDTLIVSGAETDVCVLAAVMDAIDHGYRVVVAKDAVCGSADETHDNVMSVYFSRFGQQVEVAEVDDILARWSV